MTIISKVAGGASLLSCIYDMHKCGLNASNKAYERASANNYLSNQIGSMKMDKFSYKDAQIKNWYVKNNIGQSYIEKIGKIKGYFSGFFTSAANYIPNLLAGTVALFAKNKVVATIATVAVGLLEGSNILNNTILNKDRTDYLEM